MDQSNGLVPEISNFVSFLFETFNEKLTFVKKLKQLILSFNFKMYSF